MLMLEKECALPSRPLQLSTVSPRVAEQDDLGKAQASSLIRRSSSCRLCSAIGLSYLLEPGETLVKLLLLLCRGLCDSDRAVSLCLSSPALTTTCSSWGTLHGTNHIIQTSRDAALALWISGSSLRHQNYCIWSFPLPRRQLCNIRLPTCITSETELDD